MSHPQDRKAHFDPQNLLERRELVTHLKPQEMLECPKCGKKNPANRLSCFYCVAELPVSSSTGSSQLKLNLRKLESWESGFNVMVKTAGEVGDKDIFAELAGMAGLSVELMSNILSSGILLPIARLESEKEAEHIVDAAESAGLLSMNIPDVDLMLAEQPVRLWHIELHDDVAMFITFNQREVVEVPFKDIRLCVCGQLNETRSETSNKFKKGKVEVIDELATATDKRVVDVYTKGEPRGYRISTAGFDFSALGSQKSMLAAENLDLLVNELASRGVSTRVDRKYNEVRNLLNDVWELESTDQTYGLKIAGIGKRKVDRVATSNNELQFLKYARSRIF